MIKNGKKVIYVDSNNYVENTNEENIVFDSVISQMPDKIRYYSKNYWTINNNVLSKEDNTNALIDVEHLDDETLILRARKNKFLNSYFENGVIKNSFSKKDWNDFLIANIPQSNEIFEDFYTIFNEPINIANLESSVEAGANYIKKEYIYNFFSQNYENLVNSQIFDVKTIPTVFNLLNDTKADVRTYEENLNLSLGGLIEASVVDSFQSAKKITNNVKNYFDAFAKTYSKPEALPVISLIKQNEVNNIIEKSKLSLLLNNKGAFIPFPFYYYFEFTNASPHKNDFIHVLTDNFKIQNELLENIIDQQVNRNKFFIYSGDVVEERSLNFIDLKQFISSKISTTDFGTDNSLNNSQIVSYTNLMNYLKNNLKPKIRKYKNLLETPSHNEILFYKIEKRQFNFESAPIQTYWLVPSNEQIIKFFDTQIKYGTEYYYTVSAYNLVLGTKYSYEEFIYQEEQEKQKDLSNGLIKLKVKTNSDYKIFEKQIAKFSISAFENPYTKPITEILHNNGNLVFNLLQSQAETYEKFTIIENNDLKVLEKIRKSQENEDSETIRSLLNETAEKTLEIYRIDKIPTNYIAFQGKLYKKIKLDRNTSSFIDKIPKNIKFYYMFRYLNLHETPSNVSDVLEVELKDEEGFEELKVRKIDMSGRIPRKESKDFKKYMLIKPSLLQTRFNNEGNVQSIDQVQLGPNKQKVWNKDFILRIKSKKTNRVLEFNLSTIINKKN